MNKYEEKKRKNVMEFNDFFFAKRFSYLFKSKTISEIQFKFIKDF